MPRSGSCGISLHSRTCQHEAAAEQRVIGIYTPPLSDDVRANAPHWCQCHWVVTFLLLRMNINFILGHWLAVQTWAGREKIAAQILQQKGYEIYLPLCRRWSYGRVCPDRPLFPGYLFCRFIQNVRGLILTTPGTIRIVGGQSPALLDRELEEIRRVGESGLRTGPWQYVAATVELP